MREIDGYIRFKRAHLVMNSILRHPVYVFGTGWDHVDFGTAGAQYLAETTSPAGVRRWLHNRV